MITHNYSIASAASATTNVKAVGSVVVCKAGAQPGAYIHFRAPSAQGYTGEESFPLINGETYFGDDGSFKEFWITQPADVQAAAPAIKLLLLDCATPVVVLNNPSQRGWRFNLAKEGRNLTLIDPGLTETLYADTTPFNADLVSTNNTNYMPRGWIGGGVKSPRPFKVLIYQHLTTDGAHRALMATFNVDLADPVDAVYSCSFENGSTVMSNNDIIAVPGVYPTAGRLVWPGYGISIVYKNTDAAALNIGQARMLLYSRAEG